MIINCNSAAETGTFYAWWWSGVRVETCYVCKKNKIKANDDAAVSSFFKYRIFLCRLHTLYTFIYLVTYSCWSMPWYGRGTLQWPLTVVKQGTALGVSFFCCAKRIWSPSEKEGETEETVRDDYRHTHTISLFNKLRKISQYFSKLTKFNYLWDNFRHFKANFSSSHDTVNEFLVLEVIQCFCSVNRTVLATLY
jgi:hypothetical protein